MHHQKLTISVVIPTLNRSITLKRALNSVLLQSHQPEEIIVVDNGSTDDTEEMIKSLFPQIKILREKKLGVSAARNKGIMASKGDWIALLDSDDEWYATKLERQISSYLNSLGSLRLIHTNEVWKKNNLLVNQMKKHKKMGGDIFLKCLSLCCISPSSALIKKDVFKDFGYFDENLPACEDYDFWLRFCAREEVLLATDELTVKHGGHNDQLSRKFWGMDRFRVYSLEKLITGGDLSSKYNSAAFEVLIKKINVLIKGGLNHKNFPLVDFYLKKKHFWMGYNKRLKKIVKQTHFEGEEKSRYYFE